MTQTTRLRRHPMGIAAMGFLGAAFLLGGCSGGPFGGPEFEVNKTGETFDYSWTASTLEGAETSFADLEDKVVFVNFWASWCPPCRAEMPSIQELHEELGGEDFEVLAVSLDDSLEAVTGYLDDNPEYTFPVVHTDSLPEGWEFTAIPTSYVIDRDGNVVMTYTGATDWASEESLAFFRSLVEEGA